MDITQQKLRAHSRFVIYIVGFLWALHIAIPSYIQSTFLSEYISEEFVGLAYTIASILTIATFIWMPKILQRIGNYRASIVILFIALFSVLGLAIFNSPFFLIPMFFVSFAATALINFCLDIYIENTTNENMMGKVRGLYLTSANVAWVVSPLLTGFILTNGDYWKIFITAAVLLLPVILLLGTNFKNFKDAVYVQTPLLSTLKQIWQNKNILSSFMVSFLLQFFFAWMVIYSPIYLHNHIGFSWQEISVMFSIMLLPFVLIEIPLGKLADNRWGEKEMMSIGFIIMALSTAMISFVDSKSFIVWTAILLVTRIGASIVEIMSETFFFKKVDGQSVSIMSMYRTTRPFAYVISPIFATALFAFHLDIKYLFVILGFIMFYGLRYSLSIDDTR